MEIKRYFKELQAKLEALKQYYATGLLSHKLYQSELNDLVKTSEVILDEWIKFEEALARIGYGALADVSLPENQPYISSLQMEGQYAQNDQIGLDWDQAKAFYQLMMFNQAIPHLEKVLKFNPDFELCRLFLAHCFIATQQLEQAKYHLQFLLKTTQDEELYSLVANGLACLEGTLKAYDMAHHYFEKIDMTQVREEWRPLFVYNHALTLYHLNWLQQSREKWQVYISLAPQDWKGYYWLGRILEKMGLEEQAALLWFEALQVDEHPQLIKHLARHYEQKGYYKLAAHCYQRLFKNDGRTHDQEAWIGLAWCYGLNGDKGRSQLYFLKSLSLFPNDFMLQLAYAWMLLYWNEREKAEAIITRLEQKAPLHPLVKGLGDLAQGRWLSPCLTFRSPRQQEFAVHKENSI